MIYLYIFLGGGIGSIARYLTIKAAHTVFSTDFPIGTLFANLFACAVLAVITLVFYKSDQFQWMQPMLLIGFCGGYSTFSTFSNETFELIEAGEHLYAILNIVISVLVGIGLIYMIRARG